MTSYGYKTFEIAKKDVSAQVSEVGATLQSLKFFGKEVLFSFEKGSVSQFAQGQVLIPFPNRIENGRYSFMANNYQLDINEPNLNNAIHGLLRFSQFLVQLEKTDQIILENLFLYHPGYPFKFLTQISYRITSTPSLKVGFKVKNLSGKKMPIGAGFHPYFKISSGDISELELKLPAKSYFVNNKFSIPIKEKTAVEDLDFKNFKPVGKLKLDNCFFNFDINEGQRATVELRNIHSKEKVAIKMDPVFKYVMCFSADTLPTKFKRKFIAIEPMTCAPNAFNNKEGLRVLESNEVFKGSFEVSYEGIS